MGAKKRDVFKNTKAVVCMAFLCLFVYFLFKRSGTDVDGDLDSLKAQLRELRELREEKSGQKSTKSVSKHLSSQPFKMYECATDAEAAKIQRDLVPADSKAECDEVGICRCPTGSFFDGFHCRQFAGSTWEDQFGTLKKKWKEVPAAKEVYGSDAIATDSEGRDSEAADDGDVPDPGRAFSTQILKKSDQEIEAYWDGMMADDTFTMFHASIFVGKRVIDIGSGLARQTLQFAIHGAHVTFADVVPTNLEVIRRVARAKGVEDRTSYITVSSVDQLGKDLEGKYFDVVTSFGSMHHAPRELNQPEYHLLASHLKTGGKWLQLAYPLQRWIDMQRGDLGTFWCPPKDKQLGVAFSDGWWGGDGCRTPWAEWYEPGKWLKNMKPYSFSMNWCGGIGDPKVHLANEFIWFDFVKLG